MWICMMLYNMYIPSMDMNSAIEVATGIPPNIFCGVCFSDTHCGTHTSHWAPMSALGPPWPNQDHCHWLFGSGDDCTIGLWTKHDKTENVTQ